MPIGVYIPAFSPESKIECCTIWQVFWLGYNWTPSRWCSKTNQQWYEDSVGQRSMVNDENSPFTIHHSQPYSYGDSAGLPFSAEGSAEVTGLPF